MSLNYLVLLTDITDYNFNFKKLFESKDSIIWKNCSNLTIRIDSKINKIIFNNCKNINLICNKTISGIEYFKCYNINQSINKNHKISCIDAYSSEITFNLNKKTKLPNIINEKSNITLDYND
tara:strand:+ start:102 stop:467 length:366 start_codon:yes stop_codon:yes gene_type:complete